MTNLKKHIMIPMLILIMLVTTPIAKLNSDNYVPYNYDDYYENAFKSLAKEAEALGGYVEYPMKNNYSYSTVSDYSKQSKDTIKTITIKTTPTGTESAGNYKKSEPIKNALVRIDGVPRWTNSKG